MSMPRQIDATELAERLARKEPVYLLDVRQEWEHRIAALPGSVLIPLDQLQARAAEIQPPEGALVVAYCHHGVRSLHAAAFLARIGISAVSLAGGTDHWAIAIDSSMPRY